MLGSPNSSLGNNGFEAGRHPRATARDSKKPQEQLDQLLDREWSELPYTMMRITAARRPWDNNRVYWRDRNVQLGEIDLHLAKGRAQEDASRYTAVYRHEELRRDFPLQPSFEDNQLRWTAPGITDAKLTTNQLAERLLGKLVTFYTGGLS